MKKKLKCRCRSLGRIHPSDLCGGHLDPRIKPKPPELRSREWHYKQGLSLVMGVAAGYDGYNPNSAKQMRKLVADLVEVAAKAWKDEPLWFKDDGNGKMVPSYRLPKKMK